MIQNFIKCISTKIKNKFYRSSPAPESRHPPTPKGVEGCQSLSISFINCPEEIC